MTINTSDNRYSCSKFIVAPTISEGANYTTIASALADASFGETIFVKPGTYTENLTLKSGVNICAFKGDPNKPNVLIRGKATFSAAGTATLTGMMLQTNGDYFLSVTGSSASIVSITDGYLDCTDNTGIEFSSSSPASTIHIDNCLGDIATLAITLFVSTGAGQICLLHTTINNSGLSQLPSTSTNGAIGLSNSNFAISFSVNGTGTISTNYTSIATTPIGISCIELAGTDTHPSTSRIDTSTFDCGAAAPIVVGTGKYLDMVGQNTVRSAVANGFCITGGGTLSYSPLCFPGGYAHSMNVANQIETPMSNLIITAPSPGREMSCKIQNTDNSNAQVSSSKVVISTGGTNQVGDPSLTVSNSTTRAYAFGIDTSDNESLKITTAAAGSVTPSDSKIIFDYDPPADFIKFRVRDAEVIYPGIGVNVGLASVNADSTNALSSAVVAAGVNDANAGDPFFEIDIHNVVTNKFGLDNSDSDKFKYLVGSDAGISGLEGTESLVMTQSGEFTYPLQPAFSAVVDTTITSVTGDGTIYSIVFDNEVFDQGSDFDLATSVFTAPVTGKYQFNGRVTLYCRKNTDTVLIMLSTSNIEYRSINKFNIIADDGYYAVSISEIVDMDAGDTANLRTQATGALSDIDDILGSVRKYTTFSGFLAV